MRPSALCQTMERLSGEHRAVAVDCPSDVIIRRWQHDASEFDVENPDELVLMVALSNTFSVCRREGRVAQDVRPAVGSVAVLLPGHGARYAITGGADILHVRVTSAAIKRLGIPLLIRSDPDLHARNVPLERASGIFLSALVRQDKLRVDEAVLLSAENLHIGIEAAVPHQRLLAWQVRVVRDLVEARLHHPLTIADMAREARLSPSHFAHAFRATLGQAPWAYVLDRRSQRALQMLSARSALSVETIAAACGFCDQQHLSRTLKRLHGITPGEFRRALA